MSKNHKDIYYSTKVDYNFGPFRNAEEARNGKNFGPFKSVEEALKDLEKKSVEVLFKNSQFFMAVWYEGKMFLFELGGYFDFQKLKDEELRQYSESVQNCKL